MAAVKVGLIGFGFAAKVFHAPLFPSAGLVLSAVMTSRTDEVNQLYPDAKVYQTADQICADSDLDLIIVASPSHTHVENMLCALSHGKHVVSDKPFAPSTAEIDQIAALAAEKNCLVSCFQNRRWDSDFLTLQKLIKDGTMGDILSYHGFFEFFRQGESKDWKTQNQPGVGVHYDLGSHQIDQMLTLFGMPDWVEGDVQCLQSENGVIDRMEARFGYGQMRVNLIAGYRTIDNRARFLVHGTKGSYVKQEMCPQEEQLKQGMTPDHPDYGKAEPAQYATISTVKDGQVEKHITPGERGCYQAYYRQIAEAIRQGHDLPVTLPQIRQTTQMIEMILQSSAQGQRLMITGEAP